MLERRLVFSIVFFAVLIEVIIVATVYLLGLWEFNYAAYAVSRSAVLPPLAKAYRRAYIWIWGLPVLCAIAGVLLASAKVRTPMMLVLFIGVIVFINVFLVSFATVALYLVNQTFIIRGM